MSEEDNALSRAKKALAVIPGREFAVNKNKIADLLKQAEAATKLPAPVRAVEAKPKPAPPQPELARQAHPPPAVRQPQVPVAAPSPAAVVEPQPAAPQGQSAAPTVIVNVTAPPAPYGGYPPPWWAWGWGPGCPAAFCPRRVGRACWRWSCPYW
jgi:hypothetical protein